MQEELRAQGEAAREKAATKVQASLRGRSVRKAVDLPARLTSVPIQAPSAPEWMVRETARQREPRQLVAASPLPVLAEEQGDGEEAHRVCSCFVVAERVSFPRVLQRQPK